MTHLGFYLAKVGHHPGGIGFHVFGLPQEPYHLNSAGHWRVDLVVTDQQHDHEDLLIVHLDEELISHGNQPLSAE